MRFSLATTVLGTAICGVLLLTGCATETTNTENTETVTEETKVYGSVIEGETVTDENGTYIRTTINPKDPIYTTLISNVDPALYENGYTEEELLSAQQFVAKFQAEEYSDSIALTGSGWDKWKQEIAPQYIGGPFYDDILTDTGEGSLRPSLIFNNPNGKGYSVISDGKQRITNNAITISEIKNYYYEGKNYVEVIGKSKTTYRIPESESLEALKEANPNLTEEQIRSGTPSLGDSTTQEANLINNASFSYTLEKSGKSWLIVGYRTTNKDLLL